MGTFVVASDTFLTGGTVTLEGRAAAVGGTWVKTLNPSAVLAEVSAVVSALRADGLDNSNKMFYSLGAPTTISYDVQLEVQAAHIADDPVHIVGRYIDANNFYAIDLGGLLYSFKDGVKEDLGLTFTINVGDIVRLRMSGTTIAADVDVGAGFVEQESVTNADHSSIGVPGIAWGSMYFATHDINVTGEYINYAVSDDVAPITGNNFRKASFVNPVPISGQTAFNPGSALAEDHDDY